MIDLGCGTGSNLRYLASRLGPMLQAPRDWLLIDSDPVLLDSARRRQVNRPFGRGEVSYQQVDLADFDAWPKLQAGDLVSASALIDLVSKRWLAELIGRCRLAGAGVVLALTYDGRTRWRPAHRLDVGVLAAFDRDQKSDKGFGAALGPAASPVAIDLLERAGYRAWTARSDWLLDARFGSDRRLIEPVLENHARLVIQDAPAESAFELGDWAALRRRQLAKGRLQVRVGHLDIVALPRG